MYVIFAFCLIGLVICSGQDTFNYSMLITENNELVANISMSKISQNYTLSGDTSLGKICLINAESKMSDCFGSKDIFSNKLVLVYDNFTLFNLSLTSTRNFKGAIPVMGIVLTSNVTIDNKISEACQVPIFRLKDLNMDNMTKYDMINGTENYFVTLTGKCL